MTQKDDTPFQINKENPTPDNLYREEMNDLQLERLNNRVTLISILVPILIIVVLVVSYLDIKRKVSTVEVTGSTGYQQLSAEAESRFSALSVKYASLEAELKKRLESMSKTVKALSSDIQRTEMNIKRLRGDKSTETAVNKLDAALTTAVGDIQADLKTMDANLESLDTAVNKQLTTIVDRLNRVDNRLIEQDAQLVTMTGGTVDREFVDNELRLMEERIAQTRGKDLKLLQLAVEDLQRQLDSLSSKIGAVGDGAAASPAAVIFPAVQNRPETPASIDAAAEPAPEPGQIIEQPLD